MDSTYSDEGYLIEQALAGSAAAWSYLVNQYSPPLYRHALRRTGNQMDAEDIVQDVLFVFVKAGARRWSPSKGTLASFLYNMVEDAAIDRYRRNRLAEIVPVNLDDDDESSPTIHLISEDGSPEDQLLRAEEHTRVNDAVNHLPSRQRDVVRLKIEFDLKRSKIAEILGLHPDSVDKYVRRARTLLKPPL
jgi:RNA polymerase sigma-70 factor (ECF subfamily)